MKRIISGILSIVMVMNLSGCTADKITEKIVEKIAPQETEKVKEPQKPHTTKNPENIIDSTANNIADKVEDIVNKGQTEKNKARFTKGIKMIDPLKDVDKNIDVSSYEDFSNIPNLATLKSYIAQNEDKYEKVEQKYFNYYRVPDEKKEEKGKFDASLPKIEYVLEGTTKITSINDITPENIILLLQSDPQKYNLDTDEYTVDFTNYEINKNANIIDNAKDYWSKSNSAIIYFMTELKNPEDPENPKGKKISPIYFYYDSDDNLSSVLLLNEHYLEPLDKLFTKLGMSREELKNGNICFINTNSRYGEELSHSEWAKNLNNYVDALDFHNDYFNTVHPFVSSIDEVAEYYNIYVPEKENYYCSISNKMKIVTGGSSNSFKISEDFGYSIYTTEEVQVKKNKDVTYLNNFYAEYSLTNSNTETDFSDGKHSFTNDNSIEFKIHYDYSCKTLEDAKKLVQNFLTRFNIEGVVEEIDGEKIHYNLRNAVIPKQLKIEEEKQRLSIYLFMPDEEDNMYRLDIYLSSGVYSD